MRTIILAALALFGLAGCDPCEALARQAGNNDPYVCEPLPCGHPGAPPDACW